MTTGNNLRISLRIVATTLLAAIAIELVAAITLQLILASPVQLLLWSPDLNAARAAWADSAILDPELGWLPQRGRTKSGFKENPDFPEPSQSCVAAYGDSRIWGSDIPTSEGWIEQLSRRLHCRVANYGVGDFSTGQSYLRFRTMNDNAPIVLIGISPENIRNNVNQYRSLLNGRISYSLKGRFVLDDSGRLHGIPQPRLNVDAFVDMQREPSKYLQDEWFLPDTPDGPVSVRFPYTSTLIKVALLQRVWNRINGKPSWSHFYNADHPSRALPLMIAIATAFAKEVKQRGKHALFVILPNAQNFEMWARHGHPEYTPLVSALAADGVYVVDPTQTLITHLNGRTYCELFVDCGSHYSNMGGQWLSEIIAPEIERISKE